MENRTEQISGREQFKSWGNPITRSPLSLSASLRCQLFLIIFTAHRMLAIPTQRGVLSSGGLNRVYALASSNNRRASLGAWSIISIRVE